MGGQSLAAESCCRDFNRELLMRAREAPASSSRRKNQHQRLLCLAMPSSFLPVPTHFTMSPEKVKRSRTPGFKWQRWWLFADNQEHFLLNMDTWCDHGCKCPCFQRMLQDTQTDPDAWVTSRVTATHTYVHT